ncbi:hypothetical protein C8R47DRAFT_170147 [Mycena vitilis]|nr:hypothetical protein C8R47DRAFT_170147 [Mycena vitilis]
MKSSRRGARKKTRRDSRKFERPRAFHSRGAGTTWGLSYMQCLVSAHLLHQSRSSCSTSGCCPTGRPRAASSDYSSILRAQSCSSLLNSRTGSLGSTIQRDRTMRRRPQTMCAMSMTCLGPPSEEEEADMRRVDPAVVLCTYTNTADAPPSTEAVLARSLSLPPRGRSGRRSSRYPYVSDPTDPPADHGPLLPLLSPPTPCASSPSLLPRPPFPSRIPGIRSLRRVESIVLIGPTGLLLRPARRRRVVRAPHGHPRVRAQAARPSARAGFRGGGGVARTLQARLSCVLLAAWGHGSMGVGGSCSLHHNPKPYAMDPRTTPANAHIMRSSFGALVQRDIHVGAFTDRGRYGKSHDVLQDKVALLADAERLFIHSLRDASLRSLAGCHRGYCSARPRLQRDGEEKRELRVGMGTGSGGTRVHLAQMEARPAAAAPLLLLRRELHPFGRLCTVCRDKGLDGASLTAAAAAANTLRLPSPRVVRPCSAVVAALAPCRDRDGNGWGGASCAAATWLLQLILRRLERLLFTPSRRVVPCVGCGAEWVDMRVGQLHRLPLSALAPLLLRELFSVTPGGPSVARCWRCWRRDRDGNGWGAGAARAGVATVGAAASLAASLILRRLERLPFPPRRPRLRRDGEEKLE